MSMRPHTIDPTHHPPLFRTDKTTDRLTVVPEHLREADVTFLFGDENDPKIRALFTTEDGVIELKHLRFTLSEYMERLRKRCDEKT